MRRGKEGDQGLVDAGGFSGCAGNHLAGAGAVENIGQASERVLERLAQADKLNGDRGRVGAGETHNPDAAAAGRRGDGGDNIDGGVRVWIRVRHRTSSL